MNLSKVKPIGEDEHFYHLHDGKTSFKVAKAGLSEYTHGLIRQHFDEGGYVQKEAASDAPADIYDGMFTTPMAQGAPGPDAATNVSNAVMDQADMTPPSSTGQREALSMMDAPAAAQPGTGGSGAPSTAPPPAGAPGPSGGIGGGSLSRDEKDLEAANKAAVAAENEKAAVAGRRANAETQILQDSNTQRAAKAQQIDQMIAANQARGDQLAQEIASSKIDPNHFWASKTTGQKVASAIGILLGGIGGGLNRTGQNMALQMMNKEIEADIDAQKANLGKKESLLSHYMNQGHSLQQAKQLAMADMQDVLKGQLMQNAAKFGGQDAAALAQQHVAALGQQAVQNRIAVRNEHLGEALKSTQLESERQAMEMRRAQMAMMPLQMELSRRFETEGIDPQYSHLLDDKQRERSVFTPDGKMRGLASPDAAKKYREDMEPVNEVRMAAQQFRDLYGKGGAANPLNQSLRGEAESRRSSLMLMLNKLHGLNRLTDTEFNQFQEMVPKLTDLVKPQAAAKIDTLLKLIGNKTQSMNQTYFGPGNRSTSGLVTD